MVRGLSSTLAWDQRSGTSAVRSMCKRVRFRKSDCQRCVEVCPEGAISLDPGPSISDSCTDCGLCQVACPTEAFESELCSDEYLLGRVQSLIGKDHFLDSSPTLLFRCRRADVISVNEIRVRCLGPISENVFVGAALAGISEVILARGSCSRCHWGSAEGLFSDSIRNAIEIARVLGVQEFSVRVVDRDSAAAAAVGRREMFSGVAHRFRFRGREAARHDAWSDATTELPGKIQWSGGSVKGSKRRRLLKRIVSDAGWGERVGEPYDVEPSRNRARIAGDRCRACGICAAVCPTGAIQGARDGDDYVLTLMSSECTNCSLCKEACPENAIDLDGSFDPAGLFAHGAATVARIRVGWCAICGDEIPSGGGSVCATCDKRQQFTA